MEITITFTNSMNNEQTETFSIIRKSEISRLERFGLISQGYESVSRADWEDEGFASVEKAAALKAGIEHGEAFLVKF